MSTTPSIPVAKSGKPDVDLALSASKQILDRVTGQARGLSRLEPLPSTATDAEIIARLNEIVARMQG